MCSRIRIERERKGESEGGERGRWRKERRGGRASSQKGITLLPSKKPFQKLHITFPIAFLWPELSPMAIPREARKCSLWARWIATLNEIEWSKGTLILVSNKQTLPQEKQSFSTVCFSLKWIPLRSGIEPLQRGRLSTLLNRESLGTLL